MLVPVDLSNFPEEVVLIIKTSVVRLNIKTANLHPEVKSLEKEHNGLSISCLESETGGLSKEYTAASSELKLGLPADCVHNFISMTVLPVLLNLLSSSETWSVHLSHTVARDRQVSLARLALG